MYEKINNVMVYDIISPPVAARDYSYPSIAAYEALQNGYEDYRTLAGQLSELSEVPKPEVGKEYCFSLASIHAFLTTGKQFIFLDIKIEKFQKDLYIEFDSIVNVPKDIRDRSIKYGEAVVQHILDWSKRDNYVETRTYSKYDIPFGDPSKWKPTPPDFIDGIEPNWNQIRPFVIESADAFIPAPPTKYNTQKNSQFYRETIEVYEAVVNGTKEQKEITSFWDCNPFISHHQGHTMFATKKISPGGHWIGITQIACKKTNADIMKTVESYAMVSIALFDAFISCWDENMVVL